MVDNTTQPDQPEVRGKKIVGAQVEGHAFRRGYQDEAEAPNDETTVETDDSREANEPEVEGHRFHNR